MHTRATLEGLKPLETWDAPCVLVEMTQSRSQRTVPNRLRCPPAGAVRKLHLHPVRGVASGQSVCLRRRHDDGHQGADAAQFPAGASADPAGGAAGAPAEQRAHSVQVRNSVGSGRKFLWLHHRFLLWLDWRVEGLRNRVCHDLFAHRPDSEYFRESIRHEIRKARERFSGQELSEELSRIQARLDSVELLTPDIVINLLLSYRDIQVRVFACAWIKIPKLPVCNRQIIWTKRKKKVDYFSFLF